MRAVGHLKHECQKLRAEGLYEGILHRARLGLCVAQRTIGHQVSNLVHLAELVPLSRVNQLLERHTIEKLCPVPTEAMSKVRQYRDRSYLDVILNVERMRRALSLVELGLRRQLGDGRQ